MGQRVDAVVQTLANGLAAGTLSLEDYSAGLAVYRQESSGNSPTQASKRNQAKVVVEPSDNYKFGHVAIRKLTPTGKVQKSMYLWREDALPVAEGIMTALDALPDDVR